MTTPTAGVRAGDLTGALTEYRRTRELIERNILPLATSVDGRTFECQASLHDLRLRRGGFVVLEGEGATAIAQITDLRTDTVVAAAHGLSGTGSDVLVRVARGSGTVLDAGGRPFHDAYVRPAEPGEVGAWFATARPARAGLTVGELLLAPGVPAVLDSGGLGRHTFMCGQSGSGKTYSLGVLLERVLAETSLRVVVLDPNSDYVGLGRLRDGAPAGLAAGYADVPEQVAVWRNDPDCDHPLRLTFADLDATVQAAVLGLDPVRDRDEYAVLADLLRRREEGRPLVAGVDDLLDSPAPGARGLGLRATNLGVLEWAVWDPSVRSLVQELRAPSARCTVVDLGSLDTVHEQRIVADAVLATLWDARLSRQPCLVVVDEAHNICPAEPADPVNRLTTERAVQIAAEGRKYGLYLLTSTQRPHKVHENVVSQCDNLLLMRMNSTADVADLGRLLSFVPSGLLAGATSFRMGEALVAGRLLPVPAYVRMGERVSQEGGSDVPPDWAAPRGVPEGEESSPVSDVTAVPGSQTGG
jgi:DNA helicase HerA-like ATPase